MAFFESKWPAALLWPLSRIYGGIVARRNHRYNTKRALVSRLSCPVISVGNIVVGGTGKTPTVIFLARWFQNRGKKVGVLSRGYRRESKGMIVVSDGENICATTTEAGDEPLLIAQQLPGVIVIVDADRTNAGRYALTQFKPDLLLLDDGFQHRRLHRDLDILTFKNAQDLGSGWLLPAGPLREPLASLERADLFWFNGGVELKEGSVITGGQMKPQITATMKVVRCSNFAGETLHKESGLRAVLFCGLAKPQGFYETAGGLGLEICQCLSFKDHHRYQNRDILKLEKARRACQADLIITTDKDWVKITPLRPLPPYWYHCTVDVRPENPDRADRILHRLCEHRGIM